MFRQLMEEGQGQERESGSGKKVRVSKEGYAYGRGPSSKFYFGEKLSAACSVM